MHRRALWRGFVSMMPIPPLDPSTSTAVSRHTSGEERENPARSETVTRLLGDHERKRTTPCSAA